MLSIEGMRWCGFRKQLKKSNFVEAATFVGAYIGLDNFRFI